MQSWLKSKEKLVDFSLGAALFPLVLPMLRELPAGTQHTAPQPLACPVVGDGWACLCFPSSAPAHAAAVWVSGGATGSCDWCFAETGHPTLWECSKLWRPPCEAAAHPPAPLPPRLGSTMLLGFGQAS